MAKILLIAVTLVTLFTENSYCKVRPKYPGTSNFQNNYPFETQNLVERSSSLLNNNTAPPSNNVTNNQTKTDRNKQSFLDEAPQRRKSSHQKVTSKIQRKNLLGKVLKKKTSINPEASPVTYDVTASKRVAPAAVGVLTKLAGNEKVQEAIVDKGIEVAGKLVDKSLENIEQAQKKASDFLKKQIKLDIMPDKGWETEDMFVPPGYHINAEVEDTEQSKGVEDTVQPYPYPAGIGGVMMNGCWGTGYQQGDPCYTATEVTNQCRDMIDGAAFIGVGFDGRGKYSPESRKMSIIQRSCAGKSSYDGLQVPDTMNVHGIYDTSAHMSVFTSRSEYQKYLQVEAGVSGSFFGFSAGVKSAWGSSESGAKQTNLAVFDIDVDRYEIFQDEVKPQDLSRNFLREFINLPESYFEPGAPAKFQDFILRWGTHYIKSARFGGQLEVRKTQLASMTASKEEFAMESEFEYKSLFASVGGRLSVKSGSSSKSQQSYMSTSVVVQGGSQKIAAIISDMYSPSFKTEFTAWLQSIPAYPKAFKFLMGSITDLLDFRANDLFPDESIQFHCEIHKNDLTEDEKTKKKYYLKDGKKVYCDFDSKDDLETKLKLKRMSLKRAIEVYMEEGPMSISDVSLPAGESACDSDESTTNVEKPTWSDMTTGASPATFRVTFDLVEDLKGAPNGGIDIQKSMSRLVRYRQNNWITANDQGQFHWYGGFRNGESSTLGNKKISILGLVLKYDERDGSLVLLNSDYQESKKYFPELSELLVNKRLAHAELTEEERLSGNGKKKAKVASVSLAPPPLCNVHWSNGLRFDPGDTDGKCLHFTASSKGPLYVVFSAVPSDKDTWYYIEISTARVGIYKAQDGNHFVIGNNFVDGIISAGTVQGKTLKVSTVNKNAVALGDSILYQSYFVCITETTTNRGTLVEYGKSSGTMSTADVYLSMNDYHDPLHVRFYSFGNGREPAQIVDSHVMSRKSTQATCKGDTKTDSDICVQKCHETCDPIAGCTSSSAGEPKATDCNECRYAISVDGNRCLKTCGVGEKPDKNKQCQRSYDLKFKKEVNSVTAIRGFPTLPEFSICMWINFAGIVLQPIARGYQILEYRSSADEMIFDVSALVTDAAKDPVQLEFDVQNSGMSANGPKDNGWHHFCVSRNSVTGESAISFDGREKFKTSFKAGVAPSSEGKMIIGGFGSRNFEGKISGLNIWNRVLTKSEIQNLAQSCGGDSAAGSIKDWYDIKGELNTQKYVFEEPSRCGT